MKEAAAVGDDFKATMHRNLEDMRRYKSEIIRILGASDLIACEGDESEVAKHLDISCGIDYLFVSRNSTLTYGIGCRMQDDGQFGKRYKTFTIRKERKSGHITEFEKRKAAIEKGGLYPYLTLHAYIDRTRDRIDRMALAKTAEIMDYIEKGLADEGHTGKAQIGQASFWVIDWDKYRESGRSIFVYDVGA